MKQVSGYVITCAVDKRRFFFGPQEHGSDGDTENFETNGFSAFPTLAEARYVAAGLQKSRKEFVVGVGHLRLRIAENEADLAPFRRKRNRSFVVIFNYGGKDAMNLLGKHGLSMPREFDSGGRITDQAKPFRDLEPALNLAREAKRQGQSPSAVADYRFHALSMRRHSLTRRAA